MDKSRSSPFQLHQIAASPASTTIIVNDKNDEQAVLISLSDYQNIEETSYLLRTPANRAHLEKSLENVREGKLVGFPVEDL